MIIQVLLPEPQNMKMPPEMMWTVSGPHHCIQEA